MTKITSYQGNAEAVKKHPVSGAEVNASVDEEENRTLYWRPQRNVDSVSRHAHARPQPRLKF